MQHASSAAVLTVVINALSKLLRGICAARIEGVQNRRNRFPAGRHPKDAVPECVDSNRRRPHPLGLHLQMDLVESLRCSLNQFRCVDFPATGFARTRLIGNTGFEAWNFVTVQPEQQCPNGRAADVKREDRIHCTLYHKRLFCLLHPRRPLTLRVNGPTFPFSIFISFNRFGNGRWNASLVTHRRFDMKRKGVRVTVLVGACLSVLVVLALAAQDKYTLKVPGGLAFSEFKGYESWQVVSISQNGGGILAATLANPAMISAYQSGTPGNGKPFPDGAKLAKIHWNPKKLETFPSATVPGTQHDVDFMVKDGKRFADSGGWGYAVFDYDAASDTFKPGTMASKPPQANDAKCGAACHTIVKNRDYVFTDYQHR